MSFVKDNGGPIALGIIGFAIVFGYIELRAPAMVASELEDKKLITSDQMIVLSNTLESMKDDIGRLEGNDGRLEDKVDQVIRILLED